MFLLSLDQERELPEGRSHVPGDSPRYARFTRTEPKRRRRFALSRVGGEGSPRLVQLTRVRLFHGSCHQTPMSIASTKLLFTKASLHSSYTLYPHPSPAETDSSPTPVRPECQRQKDGGPKEEGFRKARVEIETKRSTKTYL